MATSGGGREGKDDGRGGGDPSKSCADEGLTEGMTDKSVSSSQLLSGPACSTAGIQGWGQPQDAASVDLSIDTDPSNDDSYFVLDEGGRHVLDNQGSPARARKWQPLNANQRERYA